jgi:hypothetical protein
MEENVSIVRENFRYGAVLVAELVSVEFCEWVREARLSCLPDQVTTVIYQEK